MKTKLANSGLLVMCVTALGLVWALPSGADFDLMTATGIWHMNEGEGDMTMDSSASGSHGKLWRGPTWVDGRFGKALSFDGQSFVWMKPAAGVPEGTSPRTLMAHFKQHEVNQFVDAQHWLTDAEVILGTGKHNWTEQVALQISAEAGPGGGIGIDVFDGRWMYPWDADTEWHHAAAVFPEGGVNTNDFIIYFDGERVPQDEMVDALGPDVFDTVGGEVTIGCWTGGPNKFFNGINDDAAIFPYAIDPEDNANVAKRGLVKGQTMDVSPSAKLATSWGALKERE
ncbi:MAG: hypothetical protein QF554_12805 [Dehalococcoidia bacterium]|nr:hypothetical protein [Dehalococcoidia bacterium]